MLLHCFLNFVIWFTVRRHVLDEDDLDKLDDVLSRYLQERENFRTTGVRSTRFDLPRQHALCHYRRDIVMMHDVWCTKRAMFIDNRIQTHQGRPKALASLQLVSQMLLTNQRLDKLLAACTVDFRERGMLDKTRVT